MRLFLLFILLTFTAGCDGAAFGAFARNYGSALGALASVISSIVALGIAVRGWRHSEELQRKRQAPDIVIRPNRGRDIFECRLENRGETAATIVEAKLWATGAEKIRTEWDHHLVMLPGEWRPGPHIDRDDLEETGVDTVEFELKYKPHGESGDVETIRRNYRTDIRTSNPIGDRGQLSIHTRNQMERAARDFFQAKLEEMEGE